MTKEKLKAFYEKHETKIIIAGSLAVTAVLIGIAKRLSNNDEEEVEGWGDFKPSDHSLVPNKSYWRWDDGQRAYLLADNSLLRIKEDAIIH